jgi:hypothetical protein
MSSNLSNRVSKIEKGNKGAGFIILALNHGETEQEALKEYLVAGNTMPRVCLYANDLDILL